MGIKLAYVVSLAISLDHKPSLRMRRFHSFILFFLLTFSILLEGKIVESCRFSDLLQETNAETVVFCDLDNTVFQSTWMLGSVEWRSYFRKKALESGFKKEESDKLLEIYWQFLQKVIPVKLVDLQASAVINQVKEQGISIFGFTARSYDEMSHTGIQLHKLGVSFNQEMQEWVLPEEEFGFSNGVIFCGNLSKGTALEIFFEKAGFHPKRILMIDDRHHQLENVEEYASQNGVDFVGLRFSGADICSHQFSGTIADLQWSALPRILFNEEAKKEALKMEYQVVRLQEKKVIGIQIKTRNAPGHFDVDIPALWDRFFRENIKEKVHGKAPCPIYVLYTDYEGDETQPYTVFIGCESTKNQKIPEGMSQKIIPSASYAQFSVQGRPFPQNLMDRWRQIWSIPLKRTFQVDFECYPVDFNPENPSLDIFVSVAQ